MGVLEFWSKLIGFIVWPAAIIGLGFLFKHEISDLLRRVRRVEAAGSSLTFGPSEQQAARELVSPREGAELSVVETLTAEGSVDATVTPNTVHGEVTIPKPTILTEDDIEQRRKAQLELLIDSVARWGWNQAKLGVSKAFPHPFVIWNDGVPTILYGTPDDSHIQAARQRGAGKLIIKGSE